MNSKESVKALAEKLPLALSDEQEVELMGYVVSIWRFGDLMDIDEHHCPECSTCSTNGLCELYDVKQRMGIPDDYDVGAHIYGTFYQSLVRKIRTVKNTRHK